MMTWCDEKDGEFLYICDFCEYAHAYFTGSKVESLAIVLDHLESHMIELRSKQCTKPS